VAAEGEDGHLVNRSDPVPVIAHVARFLAQAGSALAGRLNPRAIGSVEALGLFVGQRASLVAQTTLYGYLKTRMGTKFPLYFSDDGFAGEIRRAAVRQFVVCAADLSIHAAALVAADGGLDRREAAGLARRCYAAALAQGLADVGPATVAAGAAEAFADRAERTAWASAAQGEAAFSASIDSLIRNAPVVEEFKRADAAIVRNSIRFRWREVRRELQRRLDAEAVREDLRQHPAG
jgi:hypothetical protein